MASPSLCIQGESVSKCFGDGNICSRQIDTAFRQVSVQFYCQTMSFLFGATVIIGLRHRCSYTVSPFNTLTLMYAAHCRVQTGHPLHYVKRVTCRIQASALEGWAEGGGGGKFSETLIYMWKGNTSRLLLIVCLHWQTTDVEGTFIQGDVYLLLLSFYLLCHLLPSLKCAAGPSIIYILFMEYNIYQTLLGIYVHFINLYQI